MLASDWLRVSLAALALYRLAQLITIDEGPGYRLSGETHARGIFERLRDATGVHDRDAHGRTATMLGRFIGCPYCIGLWLAVPLAVLVLAPTVIGDWLLVILGMAGIQTYLQGPRRPA